MPLIDVRLLEGSSLGTNASNSPKT